MATPHSSLAWRIPWTEEPDGLQSMGSQRLTHTHTHTHTHGCGLRLTPCSPQFLLFTFLPSGPLELTQVHVPSEFPSPSPGAVLELLYQGNNRPSSTQHSRPGEPAVPWRLMEQAWKGRGEEEGTGCSSPPSQHGDLCPWQALWGGPWARGTACVHSLLLLIGCQGPWAGPGLFLARFSSSGFSSSLVGTQELFL